MKLPVNPLANQLPTGPCASAGAKKLHGAVQIMRGRKSPPEPIIGQESHYKKSQQELVVSEEGEDDSLPFRASVQSSAYEEHRNHYHDKDHSP